MNITIQQLVVSISLTILASIAPYYFKKSIDNDTNKDLFIGFGLFSLLIILIYYSLKIKISFLLTVISYKVFPLIVLSLMSSFIFHEFKFTLKKWISLIAIILGVYFLET